MEPSACGPTVYVGNGSEGAANAGTAAAKAAAPATPLNRAVTIPFVNPKRYITAALRISVGLLQPACCNEFVTDAGTKILCSSGINSFGSRYSLFLVGLFDYG